MVIHVTNGVTIQVVVVLILKFDSMVDDAVPVVDDVNVVNSLANPLVNSVVLGIVRVVIVVLLFVDFGTDCMILVVALVVDVVFIVVNGIVFIVFDGMALVIFAGVNDLISVVIECVMFLVVCVVVDDVNGVVLTGDFEVDAEVMSIGK